MNDILLETDRLILRRLTFDDAHTIFSSWANDEEVTRWMSWNKHKNIEDTIAFLEFDEASWGKPYYYNFGYERKDTHELIGSGGLLLNEEHSLPEIGYCIAKAHWQQGFATEAARRIIEFAVDDLAIPKIFGRHAQENPASGHVLLKLGFKFQRDNIFRNADLTKVFPNKEYLLLAENFLRS